MRLRLPTLILAVTLGAGLSSPARAADLDKYVPDDAAVYVHVNLNQLLSADVVRKAIPLAFDKYGDLLAQFLPLMKQFNPNAPDVPEEEFKKAIAEMKKPETIAKAFDAAKDAITDIIVAGNPADEDKVLILVKGPPAITPETVEAMSAFAEAVPQLKLRKHKTGQKIVYEIQLPPPQNQSLFAAVPEAGVVCFSMKKDPVEKAVGGGKGGFNAQLKPLAAKRAAKDFLFVAVAGGGKDEGVRTGYGNLVLDKDISGGLNITYSDAKKAKEAADEMNASLTSFADTIKGYLGDKAKDVAPVLSKMKATVNGTTVNGQFTVPGSVVEKLLAKE